MGINVAKTTVYCALVAEGALIETEPFKLEVTAGLSDSARLRELADDVERLVDEHTLGGIVVVSSENIYKQPYASLVPRISIETAILIGGARAGILSERASRPDIRAKLGLPKSGQLSDHSRVYFPGGGKLWPNKRDIAALGAASRRGQR
ncbi:hypothetical protein MA5S0921_5346 [Mycobacteroides abscessus 5S-0921]|nr:hypothetical protein [Mycobacteroides abscessus]EIU06453.1 hypothetical protein MA5S0421_4621 [Mycobacteroides abscessus 5S-0421]EIU09596.1 hypothetical protein MA5S0304_4386 [Mycobacteroides abscessus 5S-0304]EIU21694.1 hypothetical protein MA5S0708_4313 [Mycobacteroides abscessus 5S-0708]EIU24691.1 hypothetical protein MA5S0817_3935 [Mycobacteroides abscessus 5S-0817]EIU31883.1 hypothetical protein MA5S1212_4070 [Mycobacteroides abscessus 5S-1212]